MPGRLCSPRPPFLEGRCRPTDPPTDRRAPPMPAENPRENPVHFPPDRRLRAWVRLRWLLLGLALALMPVAAAWAYALAFGLPPVPPSPRLQPSAVSSPHGF